MQYIESKFDFAEALDTLFGHVLLLAIMWIWYRNVFFRCFAKLSLTESRVLLFCTVLLGALLGHVIDNYILKKKPHIFFNLLFGFGLYAVMTYISIKPQFIIITISVSVIIAFAYSLWTIRKRTHNNEDTIISTVRHVRKAIAGSKQIVSIGVSVIIAGIGIPIIFGGYLIKPTVQAAKTIDSEEWTVSNKVEELSLFFDEDRWQKASLTTKLDACQILANICRVEWGINNELNVFASNAPEFTFGYYNDHEHTILINIDYLLTAPGPEICDTVVHEAYHALEYRMVDAYLAAPDDMKGLEIYQDAAIYMQEFENYQDGDDDYYLYSNQLCEKHARVWAEYMTYEIKCAVNDYYEGT